MKLYCDMVPLTETYKMKAKTGIFEIFHYLHSLLIAIYYLLMYNLTLFIYSIFIYT